MIRKPPAEWNRLDEGTAVRAVRTASAVAKGGARVVRRGQLAALGLICFFFAAMWGYFAITPGVAGSLPSLVGIGAMAAFAFWAGCRAFAKARGTSG